MAETRQAELNAILAGLAREVGLEELTFSEAGYCALGVESGRIVHLQQEGDDLAFMAELGDLPGGPGRLAKAELLLRANAFGVGTQGATLGLAPDTDRVLLTRTEAIDRLSADGIAGPLGDFIEAAEHWAAELTAEAEPAGETEAAPMPPSGSYA